MILLKLSQGAVRVKMTPVMKKKRQKKEVTCVTDIVPVFGEQPFIT
jgi:hypothetical protein